MKTELAALALTLALSLQPLAWTRAATTTINPTNRCAWAANLGWVDWRGDTNNGAVIGEYVCSGYLYSANAGWINLGGGAPANQIQYQNNSAADFGVNHDGLGNLRGYAYGANIGWIHFESTGAPRVHLVTGRLSGHAWSANCGWISLSNAVAHAQSDTIAPAPLASNRLPVPWLLQNFGTAGVNADADPDSDGASNRSEYAAGTDPNDAEDVLRITAITREMAPGTYTLLQWPGKMTRVYGVQQRSTLAPEDAWFEFYTATHPGSVSLGFDRSNEQQFYRVRAFRPLTP